MGEIEPREVEDTRPARFAPVLGMPSRGRRVPLAAAAVLVAGLAAAACGGGDDEAGIRVEAGGDPEAEQTLTAVQAAVVRAASFRFQFQGLDTTMAYWEDGPRQFTGEGGWSTDGWHLVTRDQNDASETILAGDTVYYRGPDPGAPLEAEPWLCWASSEDEPLPRDEVLDEMAGTLDEIAAEGELDDGLVDQLAVALAAGLYLDGTPDRVDWADAEVEVLAFPGDPTSFVETIGRGGTTRLLGEAGGVRTLRVTLRAPQDVADAFGRPIPDGQVELDIGPDDLPVAMRLDVAGTSESFDVEVRFSDWGTPQDIAAPIAC